MPSSHKTVVAVPIPSISFESSRQSDTKVSTGSNEVCTGSQMASTVAQNQQKTSKMWTYRVQGIPVGLDWQAAASLLESTLKLKDWELCSLAPDPTRASEQVATFEVLQPPYGLLKPRPNLEWQFPIHKNQGGNTLISDSNNPAQNHTKEKTSTSSYRSSNGRTASRQKKSTITVDKHFLGLTPLNRWDERRYSIE